MKTPTKILLFCLLAIAFPILAQTPETPPPAAAPVWLTDLATKFPWVTTALLVIGIMRLVFKPLFSIIHTVVENTPSKTDDQFLEKVETSQAFKVVAYVLDYVGSIKILKK